MTGHVVGNQSRGAAARAAQLYSVEFRRDNMLGINIPNGVDLDLLGAIGPGASLVHDRDAGEYPIELQTNSLGGFVRLADTQRFAKIDIRASMALSQGGTDSLTLQVRRNIANDPNPVPFSTTFVARSSDNPGRLYSVNAPTWAFGAGDSYHTLGFKVVLMNRSGGSVSIVAGSRLAVWVNVTLQGVSQ